MLERVGGRATGEILVIGQGVLSPTALRNIQINIEIGAAGRGKHQYTNTLLKLAKFLPSTVTRQRVVGVIKRTCAPQTSKIHGHNVIPSRAKGGGAAVCV